MYFYYRKRISHWIWHENGYLLLMPFGEIEGDPANYATIKMSKWNCKDDGRIVFINWADENKWNLSLFVSGEKKEEELIIIPDNIDQTLDVNSFMNLCSRWMQTYQRA